MPEDARRLLFVAPFAPRLDGMHGGSRAIARLMTQLAVRHSIGLVYLRGSNEPGLDTSVKNACENVLEVCRSWEVSAGRAVRAVRLGAGLVNGVPMWARRWREPACGEGVRRIVAEWRPDVVQFEFHVMAQYADVMRGTGVPRVLVQHEPGAAAAAERQALAHGLSRLAAAADHLAWDRYERRILAAFDRVVTFTERDAREVRRLAPASNTTCIPLGVDVPAAPLPASDDCPATILFVGSFGHPPNEDAAIRLARNILPLVHRQHPEVMLHLVGHEATGRVLALQGPHVRVDSSPVDVGPHVQRATIIAAPVRLGGGMRMKTLEALAAGKPAVLSWRAVEGLDVTPGEHMLLATTDEEFAQAIGTLLSCRSARLELGIRAHRWAAAHATLTQTTAAYEQLYAAVCEERRAPDGRGRHQIA